MKLSAAVIGAIIVAATITACATKSPSLAMQATPSPPIVIASEVLGRATPVAISDPELALGRVTIMPGAVIPVHHHPGTQIGVVVQGTLTYTVYTGEVEWFQHAPEGDSSRRILAGETVSIRAGDALIEKPDTIHQGRNNGTVPVVIYLSTLFPAGALQISRWECSRATERWR